MEERPGLQIHIWELSINVVTKLQIQQRWAGESVYSEEKRDALIVNSWIEECGPGKEDEKCLESQRGRRGVCVAEAKEENV